MGTKKTKKKKRYIRSGERANHPARVASWSCACLCDARPIALCRYLTINLTNCRYDSGECDLLYVEDGGGAVRTSSVCVCVCMCCSEASCSEVWSAACRGQGGLDGVLDRHFRDAGEGDGHEAVPGEPLPLLSAAAQAALPLSQKINHFPGMAEICRKDLLGRNLTRMRKHFPKEYNFFPRTWVMPAE